MTQRVKIILKRYQNKFKENISSKKKKKKKKKM